MTNRSYSHVPAMLAFSALVAALLWTTQARAQAVAAAPPAALVATANAPLFVYRSALEDYQPYTEEKIVNWNDANTTASRVGGWRAYAKEAAEKVEKVENPTLGTTPKAAPTATPAKP